MTQDSDEASNSIKRRGFLKAGAGVAATAIGITAVSGTAAAHFHGPEKSTLEIDIKPGSDGNPINPNSNGVIPVAVLQIDDFDPTSENINYRFGAPAVVRDGGGARPAHGGHVTDVDGDGNDDLHLHFPTEDAEFDGDEDEGHLHWEKGQKGAHHGLGGSDSVTMVGRGQH